MLKVGWVFYSEEHRRNIETIISLSKDKGTLDELGLGSVRDSFAGKFFPGTTTIQTRAKYFLIIPWLLEEIRNRNDNYRDFRRLLEDEERRVIKALKETEDQKGLIGKDAGDRLQRFPSSVYWSGLRTYRIILPTKIMLSQVGSFLAQQRKSVSFSNRRLTKEDKLASDYGEIKESLHLICEGLPRYPGLRKLRLPLTYREAEFLLARIKLSVNSSLLAFILNNNLQKVVSLDNFAEMVEHLGVNNPHYPSLRTAVLFDDVMKGAYIRYNLKVDEIGGGAGKKVWKDRWEFYLEYVKKKIQPRMFDTVFTEFAISPWTAAFCRSWIEIISNGRINIPLVDMLIRNRELKLKDSKRSRLNNPSLAQKSELPIGLSILADSPEVSYLNYRFNVARQFLEDIFQGLKRPADE